MKIGEKTFLNQADESGSSLLSYFYIFLLLEQLDFGIKGELKMQKTRVKMAKKKGKKDSIFSELHEQPVTGKAMTFAQIAARTYTKAGGPDTGCNAAHLAICAIGRAKPPEPPK